MAQLQMVMQQSDVIAALQLWCAAQTPPRQLNATVSPVLQGSTGSFTLTISLNF